MPVDEAYYIWGGKVCISPGPPVEGQGRRFRRMSRGNSTSDNVLGELVHVV